MTGRKGFCDIHAHILPGVDDGPRSIEETFTIVREAAEVGVGKILCTPHVLADSPAAIRDLVVEVFDRVSNAAIVKQTGVELVLGAELMLHPDLPAVVQSNSRLTINGSGKFALIEMPSFAIPAYARSVLFDLQMRGTTPIWAHPERCKDVLSDYRVLDTFINSGVLMQLNAGSLLGLYGWSVKRLAKKLLEKGMVHMCASDTHSTNQVGKRLPGAFKKCSKIVGELQSIEMFINAPSRIIG